MISTIVKPTNQEATMRLLEEAGFNGLTWKELGKAKRWHHGVASGTLSTLHKKGLIVRLESTVKGSSLYVLPEYMVAGVGTVPYGRKTSRLTEDDYEVIDRVALAVQNKRYIRPADAAALIAALENLA